MFLAPCSCAGGHVYHYDCIQRLYKSDKESRKKSSCPICRQAILSVPNKIFGNFPSEPISYSLSPSVTGKGAGSGTTETTRGNTELLREQMEFYEGRLADLEAQLEEFDGIEEEICELKAEILVKKEEISAKKNEISDLKRKIDERDLKIIETISKMERIDGQLSAANYSVKALEYRNAALKVELTAAKTELTAFQDTKLSVETERLASEITRLQSESYFKNLQKFHSPLEIVGLLAGMHAKLTGSENARIDLERETRRLKIEMERMARKTAKAKIQTTPIHDDGEETELENDPRNPRNPHNLHNLHELHDLQNDRLADPPLLSKRSPPPHPAAAALNVSKLVPSIRPKGLPIPRGTTTGTGKRSKIMEMPNGTKRIV